ncbi:mandelate racemase/muconate lactonizing enzyme family protein [Sulfolobus acidocaldarius]|uniref:mandelate racemase/muconate lactonizing enzyme family protein n=1 Tax=Sulfolobus acidocaldarius TaxID=2285 RepID=UPI0022AB3FA6|nr:mandelate racemase/muconate lactonizing enzyme family protein [Sulfolobus acidocaldarius]
MKVKDVKVHVLKVPLPEPIQFSWEPLPHQDYTFSLIELEGENGVKGYSAIELGSTYKAFINTYVRPLLINLQIDLELIPDRFLQIGSWLIQRTGALEVAIWDLIAKSNQLPLYKMLGGKRKKVKVYASTGRLMDVKETIDLINDYYSKGIDIVKIRFRRNSIKDDLALLREIRKTFGDSIRVAVDANQAWTFTPPYWDRMTALKVAKELEQYDVEWLEEPLYREDIEGYRWLRERSNIKISGGELEYDLSRFKAFVDSKALDIVQADAVYSNGIRECRVIASLAESHNLEFLPHAWDPGMGWVQMCIRDR